jgi:hypothetical protein
VIDEKVSFTEEYQVKLNNEVIPKTVMYYPALVKNKRVTPQLTEIQNFGWFTFEDAYQKVTFDVTRNLLEAIRPYLKSRT